MRINLLGMGMRSGSPYITAKRIVNMLGEVRPAGEKSQVVAIPTPGLNLFTDFGDTPGRGAMEFEANNLFYEVHRGTFYSVNNAGTRIALGTMSTTSGRVSIADNGFQICIVDGTSGYIYTTAAATLGPQTISSITRSGTTATLTTASPHGLASGSIITVTGALPAAYNGVFTITSTGASTFTYVMASDPGGVAAPVGSYTITPFVPITSGLPANPTTVTFLGGRFVFSFNNSGRFYWSELYDGLTVSALSFSNAETNPDPVVAVWASNGQLILFGTRTTEYQGNSGALDNPFALIGGTASEWGLAARWSVAKYDNSVMALYKNRMGEVMVAKLNGYLPQKISTPDIDKIINGYANVADASAYSYMLGGHSIYVINFQGAGATWLYDGMTQYWTELKSAGLTRHRIEFGFSYLARNMGIDYSSGRVYTIDATALTDNGDTILRQITGETISDPDGNRIDISKIRLDMEVGNGTTTGQGSNPQIGLELSRDNGNTFSAQLLENVGPLGQYTQRVEWRRGGTAYSFVPRFTISDPINPVLVSASINPSD